MQSLCLAAQATPKGAFGAAGVIHQRDLSAEFERLYKETYRKVYNLAFRMVGNITDAEDITQETFMRAWSAFERFDGVAFKAWITRILTNAVFNRTRNTRNRITISLDVPTRHPSDGEPYTWEIADDKGNPEALVLSSYLDESIQKAFMALPVDYRAAVLLADLEERSYEEIASILGCAIGTVRSRVHRGRCLLRRSLRRTGKRRDDDGAGDGAGADHSYV